MGAVVSKVVNGVGASIGGVFVAPIKKIFTTSCEGVCSGTWDVICFIENLCFSNLVKLLMILGLCYIILLFVYLLFKLGIIQCIGRSLCKMIWAACRTYWHALKNVSCFLWHKLKNTKRVYRGRRRHSLYEEEGFASKRVPRERRSVRERRKDWMQRSLHPSRHRSKLKYWSRRGSHHRMRWKMTEGSVRPKYSGRPHNSRQLPKSNAAIVRVHRRRKIL